jgi:hypothetical protein
MRSIQWVLFFAPFILVLLCRGPLAWLTASATPTLTPTPTKTPTAIPTDTSTPTDTPTITPLPTYTPLPTDTPTPTPTLTNTPLPLPTNTPAVAPIPPTPVPATPAPTETPVAQTDFRIASWRLWPLALNSGCAKGMHTIFITVLDVEDKPFDGVIVGDTWNNVEEVTGRKGLGKTEINLWANTMQLIVKRHAFTNEAFTSEVSFPFSSFMTTIPNDQMIQAGYCANEADCNWKREHDSYYCGGHYSWEVVFQATRPVAQP